VRSVESVNRLAAPFLAAALLVGATACGSTRPRPVPNVTGERLDVAEDTLDALGLRYRTAGGGTFGIVVRSNWLVCRQLPAPRHVASTVLLTVARSCTVPRVVGENLDDARDELESAGVAVRVHSLDDSPVVVESFWTVCRQRDGGESVELYVSHDCWWYS
jgi:hypothetical protein